MTINIGLLGFGNVGTGVVKYLLKHGDEVGLNLKAVAVANPDKPRKISFPYITDVAYRVIGDPDVQIVVELIGGEVVAKDYIMEAVGRGKSVVTANKAVISKYGREIFDAARKKGVDVGFEAAVGGGIPIIQNLREGLAASNIYKIMGIVNGTSNYMLTKMSARKRSKRMTYEDALRLAQQKGFAEADPTLDVTGEDSRQKLAILASVAWDTWINPNSIQCEGITGVTQQDIDYAAKGYTIKLLAIARKHDDTAEVRVNPALIKLSHPLAKVRNEFNAIYLEGDLCGPQMYYGKGAGSEPTTNAVMSDINRIARNIRRDACDELPTFNKRVRLVDDPVSRGYIRMDLIDVPLAWYPVAGIVGKRGINMGNIIQSERYSYNVGDTPIMPNIVMTGPINDNAIKEALEELEKCDKVHGKPFYLRIED